MSGTIAWVKLHPLVSVLTACLLILTGCIAGMVIHDARSQPPTILVFGGNTDKGDGNGGGAARDQLIAGGWGGPENIYQITWNADIARTSGNADAAMAAGHAAYNERCADGCIIAGFSLGSAPAIQLSDEVNQLPENIWLFGAPQPSTGIWHAQFQDNPFAEPYIAEFGDFKQDRVVKPGTHDYFDIRDPYNNIAPQCQGPGLYALTLDGHRIITRAEADASHQWTGTDGVLMFEVGYMGPVGLPASGADQSQPWAGCYANDWKDTFNSPGPGVGGSPSDAVPGVPTAIPTELPALPHP